jgi:hypothetical protein
MLLAHQTLLDLPSEVACSRTIARTDGSFQWGQEIAECRHGFQCSRRAKAKLAKTPSVGNGQD